VKAPVAPDKLVPTSVVVHKSTTAGVPDTTVCLYGESER
jgi:hypothetical protein